MKQEALNVESCHIVSNKYYYTVAIECYSPLDH